MILPLKFKRFYYKRRYVFLSLLLVNVFIILVAVGGTIMSNSVSTNLLDSEISKAQIASLKQLQQMIDLNLRNVERISVNLSIDKRIEALSYVKGELDPHNLYSFVEIQQELQRFEISNDIIDRCLIFFKNSSIILTSQASYLPSEYNRLFTDNPQSISGKEWQKIINGVYTRQYTFVPYFENTDNIKQPSLMLLQSLPIYPVENPDSNIIIFFKWKLIQKMLTSMDWIKEGTLLIIDEQDQIVSEYNSQWEKPPEKLRYSSLSKSNEIQHITVGNKKYVVIQQNSTIAPWKYISVIPIEIFISPVRHVRLLTIGCILLFVFLDLLIAGIYAKKNSKKVKRLLGLITVSDNINENNALNEYDIIEKSMQEIINDRKYLEESVKNQRDTIKNAFLLQMLQGYIPERDDFELKCRENGIYFISNKFAIIAAKIKNIGKWDQNSTEEMDNYELIKLNLRKVLSDSFRIHQNKNIFQIDDILVCIVSFTEENEEYTVDEIKKSMLKTWEYLNQQFGVQCIFSISRVHYGIKSISLAYQQALSGLEFMRITGGNSVIAYADISKKDDLTISNNRFEKEVQFTKCIRAKEYGQGRQILRDIALDILPEANISLQMAKCRLFGLMNMILNAFDESRETNGKGIFKRTEFLESILGCNSISDLQIKMEKLLEQLQMHTNENDFMETKDYYADALNYIHMHYTDPNINVSEVADYLSISLSHLSREFKKWSGLGMLDYIHNLRVQKAKELLKDNQVSIKNIAVQSGFYSSVSMIRAFKKIEMMTPGQFRDLENTK